MNVNKKTMGIATCVGIVLVIFFLVSHEAAYLDPWPSVQRWFGGLGIAFFVLTVLSFIVWFNADGSSSKRR
jgi:hypothetical protein